MEMNKYDLLSILESGGGLKIKASRYSTEDLIELARAGSKRHATLILVDVGKKNPRELAAIAAAGRSWVIIELD